MEKSFKFHPRDIGETLMVVVEIECKDFDGVDYDFEIVDIYKLSDNASIDVETLSDYDQSCLHGDVETLASENAYEAAQEYSMYLADMAMDRYRDGE